MNYIYRVYGWRYQGGVEHILSTPYKTKAIITGNNLNPEEYMHYLIIEHDIARDCDFPIIMQNLHRKGRSFTLKRGDKNV